MQISRRSFLKTSGLGIMGMYMGNWIPKFQTPPSSSLFWENHFGVTKEQMEKILQAALSKGGEFAELFFEYRIANAIRMEEEIIKETSQSVNMGVGIRVIRGEQTGYAYTNDLSFRKMKETALIAAAIANSSSRLQKITLTENKVPHQVYDLSQAFDQLGLKEKISLVQRAYSSAQKFDARIVKIQVWLGDEMQYVTIANSKRQIISDARPQVRLSVRATAEKNSNRNTGFYSGGGRVGLGYFETQRTPETIGQKAAEEAIILLSAIDPPAGEQPVVLGAGDSGVMIHEAVGHPLEADANRKKTSIMWDKLGKQVASPLVTIYDDPTLLHYRGSLNIDDEGTLPQKTLLIEKGKLVGYLQDRLSAKLMGMTPTGHGRRENFEWPPIPRMCNTVLEKGETYPEDIIRSVKKGFYAMSYQGGQVQDSGKFTFSVNLGYLIENGKLTFPIKNATLIGTNVQILNEIEMVGNDMGFFLGTCGKEGQSVPVTAGTPTLKIRKMTVGGRV